MQLSEIILNVIFYLIALVAVISSFAVATSKNIVRTAYYLFFCLLAVGGLYGIMGADFLLGVQILVYVGGILVLILFAIMITRKITDINASNETVPSLAAFVIVMCILFALVSIVIKQPWQQQDFRLQPLTAKIGEKLCVEYMFPFELASVLLVAAIIGAVYLIRKEIKS